ncbi:hypothetical protein LFL96_03810 [Paraburkholderia sp. D15]|uniref:hypothetical protein n=1 Tax=Paraburkholderia sp. D15 TaxID=2880218 RepID=UPI0024783FEA|nr:hypothetical protein [Paraburkholderia sp. D15]WGS50646.1 hypothetical protein LFL96_03810 [Paraburkholderia sp. D15]
MKVIRILANVGAVLLLSWVILHALLDMQFAPWATIGLVRVASYFGIDAPDTIEAFGGLLMLIFSLVLATASVFAANKILKRKPQPAQPQ